MALALSVRALVVTLAVLMKSNHGITITRSVGQGLQPQTSGDGKIPSGWRTRPPPRDIQVSRATQDGIGVLLAVSAIMLKSGAKKRPGRQQAWLLELWLKVGSSRGVEHSVAKKIVTAGAIPTATADQSMVAETVEETVATWAMRILAGERNA